MSVKRALVDCAVLSLQDSCVFYPCCQDCFSKIDVEQQRGSARCRCCRCGYSCVKDDVEYRYRLSLRVTRDESIFGITVFGASLNKFFGVPASSLQRLVDNSDGPVGPLTRSMLLLRAVEDCFIGRRFIFGIKVSKTQNEPWSGNPVGSNDKETANFIASQMILPQAPGLGGCTVVSYFQILLQKAAEYELGSTDPNGIVRHPETPLLLIPHPSPADNFTLSGLPSQLLPRSQPLDCTLSPTPPWQQSLGLVTSSAEQEEGYSTLESGDERSTQTDNNKIPHHRAQRICTGSQKTREATVASSAFSLEYTWNSGTSFAKYLDLSVQRTDENSPTHNLCISLPPPSHNSPKEKDLSAKTCLSSSLAWEDLPFSESLSEFLCEENKGVNIVGETQKCPNVQNQTGSQNLTDSTSVHHTTTLATTEGPAQIFLDITNTTAQNRGGKHDSSHQVCTNLVGCLEKDAARNIFSLRGNHKNKTASTQEELLEEDAYNCSADLFSSSLDDMTSVEDVRMTTEDCSVITNFRLSEKADVLHLTPEQPRLRTSKCTKRDMQDMDFIPPSQSTPLVKVAAVSKLASSTTRRSVRRMTPQRQSHRFNPKTNLCKPDKFRSSLLNWQYHRVCTTPNRGSTAKKECDSSWCGHEDSEVVVPPTPATKTKPSVNRGRSQTDNSSCDFAFAKEEHQRDTVDYKRTCRSSQRGLIPTGSCGDETIKDDGLDVSVSDRPDYENEACDWSRDLFSDSV